MSSTSTPETVEPFSEPERILNRNLRERARAVAAAIEREAIPTENTDNTMAGQPPGRTFNDLS